MLLKVLDQRIAQSLIGLGFRYRPHHGLFILDIHKKTKQEIWVKVFHKHDRQAVKFYDQAQSSFGFVENEHYFNDFLSLHRESMNRKGYRVRVQDLASRIRSNFGMQFRVAHVSRDNKMIAAQSLLCDLKNSTVHFAPSGYSRTKNIHSSMTYMNWKIIEWASEAGYRYVNFGPALQDPSNPVYRSKEKFGGEFVQGYRFTLPIPSRLRWLLKALGQRSQNRDKKVLRWQTIRNRQA
jgi:hypothetical protein